MFFQKKLGAQAFISGKREREYEAAVNVRRTKSASIEFAAGMIVCVPFKDDITGTDSYWLAKVLSSDLAELTLIELAPLETIGHYRSNLHSVWREPITACHLCDVDFDEAKNVYLLRTPPSEITAISSVTIVILCTDGLLGCNSNKLSRDQTRTTKRQKAWWS